MSEQKRTILAVDDNSENLAVVVSHLKEADFAVAFAREASEALEQLKRRTFDLVLLDIMMPGMDGYELCRKIKAMPEYKDVPVMFLTAKGDKQSILDGFEVGAIDYIVKPFYGPELVSRVRAHVQARAAHERLEQINVQLNKEILRAMQLEEDLKAQREELARANQQLHEMATRDPVTGLSNRRNMLSILEYERERVGRSESEFTLVLADIDHFKRVNDTHGHDCGDHVLEEIGTLLNAALRQQDQVARWGGEEFLILLPDTDEAGAEVVTEKLRANLEEHVVEWNESQIQLTMTFGIASCAGTGPIHHCLKRADQALYYGKETGRNRSVLFSRDVAADGPTERTSAERASAERSEPSS